MPQGLGRGLVFTPTLWQPGANDCVLMKPALNVVSRECLCCGCKEPFLPFWSCPSGCQLLLLPCALWINRTSFRFARSSAQICCIVGAGFRPLPPAQGPVLCLQSVRRVQCYRSLVPKELVSCLVPDPRSLRRQCGKPLPKRPTLAYLCTPW